MSEGQSVGYTYFFEVDGRMGSCDFRMYPPIMTTFFGRYADNALSNFSFLRRPWARILNPFLQYVAEKQVSEPMLFYCCFMAPEPGRIYYYVFHRFLLG